MANHSVVTKEAELQARLESRIRKALPLLPAQIKLEHYLHLRLGHHRIVIDGTEADKSHTSGRYDVLVLADDRPLLIAELKAPGIGIEEKDIKQALSYARLHDPLVPLVMVTNGEKTLVRRTYDGADIDPVDLAAENLKSVLSAASIVAASESEDAIRTLLGSSQATWSQVFTKWNGDTIATLTGGVRDFMYPIAEQFSVPRDTVAQIKAALSEGHRVVVLHGPPLSGVTNVLVQMARVETADPMIFVAGKAAPDILQHIANSLSRELSFGVSKDDVRNWLNTGRGLTKLVIVVDGLPKEYDELLDFASADLFRLVIGVDSETFRQSCSIFGRVESSLLGRLAVSVELLPLSDREFNIALEIINKAFAAVFYNGAQHSPDLRWPRALRVLAAALPTRSIRPPAAEGHCTRRMIDPILGPLFLDRCGRAFVADPKVKFLLQKVAKVFLFDVKENAKNADWVVGTWGRPSIGPLAAEQLLVPRQIEELVEIGFLSWTESLNGEPRLLIRVEELLAYLVAEEWAMVLVKLKDSKAIESELKRLIDFASIIPAGEISLALAIFRASMRNVDVLDVTLRYLVREKPKPSRLMEGTCIDLLAKDCRIRLNFGEGVDEKVIGNIMPWLVLSHLMNFPIKGNGLETTVNAQIFEELGSSPHFIYQPRPSNFADAVGIHFHDIPGIGSLPCLTETGIVEPLLQAMLKHAYRFPNELVILAAYAVEKKEAHLAWRLLTVAITVQDSTDNVVAQAAIEVRDVLREWWGNAMKEAMAQHGAGRATPSARKNGSNKTGKKSKTSK